MAAGACTQHGRRAEAGKRIQARLQRAALGREGRACVSMNRMSSEHAQGGVVGSRLCAHACRGAGEMECAVARASKAGNSPGMG